MVRGGPVPPRVQVEAAEAPSAVRRLHRGQPSAQGRARPPRAPRPWPGSGGQAGRRSAALSIGDGPLLLIAGPCVIESEAHALSVWPGASATSPRAAGVPYVFKASYDKANRTSLGSFRGPGLAEGVRILRRVREEIGRAGPDRHPRAGAGGAGRRGRRRPADSGVPLPPDRPAGRGGADRPRRQHQEGTVPRARPTCATRSPRSRRPATSSVIVTERGTSLRLQQPRRRHARASRCCARSVIRSSTTSRTACSCPAPATASPPARPSTSSRWRRRASRPASTASSWRSTSDPKPAKSDAQNALRLDLLEPLLARLVRIHAIAADDRERRRRTPWRG